MGILQKQVVPIALGAGIDTKTDKKKVAVGSLLTLENAVIRNSREFSKRDGYRLLSQVEMSDGTLLPPAFQCATFNDEMLQFDGQKAYSYSPSNSRWIDKGLCASVIAKTVPRVSNTLRQFSCDSAANGSNAVYAWASDNGISASIYDEATGTSVLSEVVLGAGSYPRCAEVGGYFFVFWNAEDDGVIKFCRISATNPIAFESAVTFVTDLKLTDAGYPFYDIAVVDDIVIVTYLVVAGGGVKAIWVGSDGTINPGGRSTKLITATTSDFTNVVAGPTGYVYVTYTASGTRVVIIDNSGTILVASFLLYANGADNHPITVTGMATATGVKMFIEVTAFSEDRWRFVAVADVSTGGAITGAGVLQRTVGLWSRAFSHTDSNGVESIYVAVVHGSDQQGCYFVVRSDGLIVAKYQYTLADGLQGSGYLSSVWALGDNKFCFPIINKRLLTSENGGFYSLAAVSRASVDFTERKTFRTAQLGKNLHISGGFLNMYDGQSVVEHGFHLYPEIKSALDDASGSMANGTYRYIAVFEWTDNFGQRHLSAPSLPTAVTTSGGLSAVTVKVNALALTAKRGTRSDVTISLYRTEADGAIFYRTTSLLAPTYNDPDANYVAIVDGKADATLISGEILYTTGGDLDNWPAPACESLTVFKNRLWLGGLENENDVWFSKEHRTDVPVEFSSELLKTVDPTSGGGVRCLFPLDDKLIAFRKENYLYTYGDGPNNTGQNGAFAEFIDVTADVGCDNADSLVALPDGVAMQTKKGIYKVLGSSLQAEYFGAPVAAFNALTVTSAVQMVGTSQVRFTTEEGAILVFDSFEGQWATFTGLAAFGAVIWQDAYTVLRANGQVYVEEAGRFKDHASPVRVRIETGWIALAGLGGFMRAYQLRILGEYKTPHTMKVSVAYDFEDFYSQVEYFNPEDMLGVTKFGDDPTFGDSDVFGGEGIAYRLRLDFAQQKCEAIKLLIEETTTAATEGTQEAFRISALSLYVGMKQGPAKYRQSQTIGD